MKKETKAERKFALFNRLAALGFTYEESQALYRAEMTLNRWACRECGDGSDWAIERDEATGKPFMTYHGDLNPSYITTRAFRRYAIADREAGALKRVKAIVDARNKRGCAVLPHGGTAPNWAYTYHQTDPRGCALYLVTTAQLTGWQGERLDIDSHYTRGLAVCC